MPSGSKNFSLTFHDLAVQVLKKLGVYQAGETANPDDLEDVRVAFNLMTKEWSALGIDIPWRETVTVFLSQGQTSYRLGENGDHVTSSFVETTLSGAMVAGDTSLLLTNDTGINAYDHVGVQMDNGVIHWSTFGGVDMMTDALPSAASAGNPVYAYTTAANRPQRILTAFRRDNHNYDTPVMLIGESAYQNLSSKSQNGPVNQIFYRQSIPTGTLFVWPSGYGKLVLITQALADDVDAVTDTMQFPIEWANALVWNLAMELGPNYGTLSAKDYLQVARIALQKREDLMNYDVENASVIVSLER